MDFRGLFNKIGVLQSDDLGRTGRDSKFYVDLARIRRREEVVR